MRRLAVPVGTLLAAALVFSSVLMGDALAQSKAKSQPQETGVPNALQGFSKNKDEPVQIEAATLEVRDKDKTAVFKGNVVVTQGDTVMKCTELRVFYDQDDPKGATAKKGGATMKAAQPGPGGRQSIRRLEARGGVVVTMKDQTATGDTGIFEMKSNTVTLIGRPVVMTQGTNVLTGDRLVVDLTTSFAKVEGGRVKGLFSTNKDEKSGAKDEKSGAKEEKPTPGFAIPPPPSGQKPSLRSKPTALPPPAAQATN